MNNEFETSLWPIRVFRPLLTRDGNQWCFLYGGNLMDGIAGFGATVEEAAVAFSRAVREEKIRACGVAAPTDKPPDSEVIPRTEWPKGIITPDALDVCLRTENFNAVRAHDDCLRRFASELDNQLRQLVAELRRR